MFLDQLKKDIKMSEQTEKVILEAKIPPAQKPEKKEQNILRLSINEEQAAANIAKSLVQDFMTLITIAGLKAIFLKFPNREEFMADLKDAWKHRTSTQIAEETKVFQNSIMEAFSSEATVSQETTEKMNKQLQSFYATRDKSVEIAEQAIDNIIEAIVKDDVEKKDSNTETNKTEKTDEAR